MQLNNNEINQFCYINLSEIIANHASKLLWGNGYNFSSEYPEYKKAIEKLKQWNNLDSIFYQDAHTKSFYGYSLVTIDKTKGNEVYLNLAQPYAVSRVARYFGNEELASVWSRITYDDQAIYIKTIYTKQKIIRYFISDTVSLDGSQEEISKNLKLPRVENHNLGIIPVKFMQNLPKKNFFGGAVGDYYPDMSPVRRLQHLLDRTFATVWKELDYNRTRVFLDITNTELQQLQTAKEMKELVGDFILQANLRQIGSTSGQPPIEVLQGNPVLDKYTDFIQFIIDKAFEGSGYSPINDTTSQRTEAEVIITNSRDMETTRIKRTLNQSDWNDIFQRCFILMGLDGDKSKWTFEIKENTIINRMNQLEISERKIALGLSNLKREIIALEGVSEEEAEQILEENRRIAKENATFIDEEINNLVEKKENENASQVKSSVD